MVLGGWCLTLAYLLLLDGLVHLLLGTEKPGFFQNCLEGWPCWRMCDVYRGVTSWYQ